MTNPFKKGSISYSDFETMSDLKWHCTKCELKAAQAKTWQIWRQEKGIQLDTNEKGDWCKRTLCPQCKTTTVHRKLKSLEILEDTKSRSGVSQKVAKKIKCLYNNEEAIFLRKLSDKELEIDHKFPQVRWLDDEKDNNSCSDEELKERFILLNRSNNLLKSRYCEKCFKEDKRGYFPGIKFWYEGNEEWLGEKRGNKKGCVGCFWNNPYKWREELKRIINKIF